MSRRPASCKRQRKVSSINSLDFRGYGIRVFPVSQENGGGWAAVVPELPGCSACGDSPSDAMAELQDAIDSWIQVTREFGDCVPEPKQWAPDKFSGKLTVRLPKSLHRELAECASEQGVSINSLMVSMISRGLAQLSQPGSGTNVGVHGSHSGHAKRVLRVHR